MKAVPLLGSDLDTISKGGGGCSTALCLIRGPHAS